MPKKKSEDNLLGLTKKQAVMIGVVVFLFALAFFFRGFFIAASVNGRPIARIKIVQELERQGGKNVLDQQVSEILLLQEAKRRKITVSEKEIEDELKKIESTVQKQGRSLDQLLSAQNMTRKDLKKQLMIQKTLEKMFEGKIKVTDDEVDKFVEENKELITQGTETKNVKTEARQQLQQQKLNQEVQKLLEDLKKKASILYFVNY